MFDDVYFENVILFKIDILKGINPSWKQISFIFIFYKYFIWVPKSVSHIDIKSVFWFKFKI